MTKTGIAKGLRQDHLQAETKGMNNAPDIFPLDASAGRLLLGL
jgi:hypothetical protein